MLLTHRLLTLLLLTALVGGCVRYVGQAQDDGAPPPQDRGLSDVQPPDAAPPDQSGSDDLPKNDGPIASPDLPPLDLPTLPDVKVKLDGPSKPDQSTPWTWHPMPATSITTAVNGIWGSDPGNLFIAGEFGAVAWFDGMSWSKMAGSPSARQWGIWGASAKAIWVVGDYGDLHHYDGAAWSKQAPLSSTLLGVKGASATTVYAAGYTGTVLVGGTAGWVAMTTPTTKILQDVWVQGPGNAFAVGWDSTFLQLKGSAWGAVPTSAPGLQLLGVWGSSTSDVYAVASGKGEILRYDGTAAKVVYTSSNSMSKIWGSGPKDIFAVGLNGMVLHYDGASWSKMASGTTQHLRGVWGLGPGQVYAVGDGGTVLRYGP